MLALGASVLLLLSATIGSRFVAGAGARAARFAVPSNSDELLVVSSPGSDPPGHLAVLQAYERAGPASPWRSVFGPWSAEIGSAGLRAQATRREGDRTTPEGVFRIGATLYGDDPNPGGLHYAYHQLACGDWWDEDPYSPSYNRFVHMRCGVTPAFAAWSEPLWTETIAYPYFAVVQFNVDPTIRGAKAPGSGIFLHSWLGAGTEGCIAVREAKLLELLRWLAPSARPVIEVGTDAQVYSAT